MPEAQFSALPAGKAKSNAWSDPVYRAQLQMIYGGASGVAPEQVPSWVTLTGASRLRGAQVNMR